MSRTIAIVGAECSGKSTLAAALGRTLPAAIVPEYLRSFVDLHGRPPSRDEQLGVMHEQIAREERAAVEPLADWIVSDGGALMTAVYSLLYYEDGSLLDAALAHHRAAYTRTVLCDIDLPWAADGAQRDGEEYRRRGHAILSSVIEERALDVLRVSGGTDARLDVVVRALAREPQTRSPSPNS